MANATLKSSTTTFHRQGRNDRAFQLSAPHLSGDHRPAGLCADFCEPHARNITSAPPGDGDPFVADRLGDFDVLRTAWPTTASHARNQPGELSHRRRDHALLHRDRHGFLTPDAAARSARPFDWRTAPD